MIKVRCLNCKKIFSTYKSRIKIGKSKFCSPECHYEFIRGKENPKRKRGKYKVCPICGKQFWAIPYHIRRNNAKYCSRKCYAEAQKGHAPPTAGQKPSLATRKKMSKSQIKRFDRDGRSDLRLTHRNLRLRRSLKFKIWRNQVFKRDDYTCQICRTRSGQGKRVIIHPDHIVSFAKLLHKYNPKNLKEAYSIPELWDIENGRTLCIDCHEKTDNYKGKGHGSYKNYFFDGFAKSE